MKSVKYLAVLGAAIVLVGCEKGAEPAIAPQAEATPDVSPTQAAPTPEAPADHLSARLADLASINSALEAYNAANGEYPKTSENRWGSVAHSKSQNWIPGLVPDFLVELPRDPAMSDTVDGAQYLYKSDGSGYKLVAHKTGDCDRLLADPAIATLADPKRSNAGKCWAWGYWTPNYTDQ